MMKFSVFRVTREVVPHGDMGRINASPDHGDIGLTTSPLHFVHTGYLLHFFYNILIMRRHQLPAIVPISFISVVFLWVMRSGANKSSLAMQVPDGKAQFRSRPEGLE